MTGARNSSRRGAAIEVVLASLFAAVLVGFAETTLLTALPESPLRSGTRIAFIVHGSLLWALVAMPVALALAAVPAARRRGGGLAFRLVLAPALALCLVGVAKRQLPSLPFFRLNLVVDASLLLLAALWIIHCWRRPGGPPVPWLAWLSGSGLLVLLLANAGVAAGVRALQAQELNGIPRARKGLADVVLVTLDTVRRDRMGLHGGPAETPQLEALARDGVLLENHVAQAPLTGPSHYALLSSSYTSLDRWGWRLPTRAASAFAPEVLRRAGYRTGAFVSAVPLRPSVSGTRFGFDTFDACFNPIDRLDLRLDSSVPARVLENLGWVNYLEREGARTTDAALEWVRGVGERPFLLWVHYYDPHEPHPAAPVEELRYHRQPGEPLWPRPPGVEGIGRAADDESYDREARAYAYAIHYVDRQVGRLIEGLSALGRFDRTLLVATADHGELIGDHGGYYDHRGAWEPVVQVFCVAHFPGGRYRGTRVAAQTRHVDLFPTIFDYLDVEGPASLDGVSLLPLLRGELRERDPDAFVDAGRSWALRSPPWKYVVDSEGVERLYRIEEAPERTNWLLREPEVARELAARLGALRRPRPAPEGEADPAALERLRALGYAN